KPIINDVRPKVMGFGAGKIIPKPPSKRASTHPTTRATLAVRFQQQIYSIHSHAGAWEREKILEKSIEFHPGYDNIMNAEKEIHTIEVKTMNRYSSSLQNTIEATPCKPLP
ncbi:MAG: hypothetical protein GY862_32930, partial [Gammaproteobacteria bacterium]|nr:hypothetical protein [Gammaproteobacteria bacterium]